ncbi:M20/M25/M40 family metallo-hydrolase [Sphingomonas sabuli]|uniref:M20/M25/M40 family metallo-hydrolase n=1 Tax=Sphingomonas sabuli TaxID=2764186 RepID=A0A7G9L1R0_9SPHN|nr:M20/M25/M40 family metallo-hydrolase [Sphingomonas sabuli]QNM82559.1 M20/M25/M40 family metallo-hydrolase [Sphingomonas sabuli]
MRTFVLGLIAGAALVAPAAVAAQSPVNGPIVLSKDWQDKSRALYKTAIEIPTVAGRGAPHKQMADWLTGEYRKNGWAASDVQVLPYDGSDEKKYAVYARWPAAQPSGKKPILIIAHMDVVEAKRADWELDPFKFVEKDGYFYGRGTSDDKQGVIATTAALFKLRADGFKPDRDIIVFYSGDEETDGKGALMAANDWRKLTDAEFALNADAGGGAWDASGRSLGFGLQTAEKIYQDYRLTATNRGGHSSRPRPDNAIYDLSRALLKLGEHRFVPKLNETTRAYYTARAVQEGNSPLGNAMRAWLANPDDAKAADAIEASELEVGTTRTRCVATMLDGGHAPNALPQKAEANVNCRALPGSTEAELTQELQAIVGPSIKVATVGPFKPSPPSPLRDDVVGAYTKTVRSMYGNDIQIVPQMSTGATDGLFFRQVGIPVYGVDMTWGISPVDERAHGLDERMPVRAFYNDVAGWEMLIRDLAG